MHVVGSLFAGELVDAPEPALFMYQNCMFVAACAPFARGDHAYRIDFYPLDLKLAVFVTEDDFGERHNFEKQTWFEISLALVADGRAPPVKHGPYR